MKGYAGKILKINLSSSEFSEIPTLDFAEKFIGGGGIAARLYWDEAPLDKGALDPDNALIFMTGPLAGFTRIAGSRWQIWGKSPTSGTFSFASLGGSFGAWLKFSGFDGILIKGKSEKPCYLLIQDGKAEIRDASSLWGKNAVETREILKETLGRQTRIAAIGPAGENKAIMATVFADDDAAGSGGFGAVMGSKGLKAVAVRGERKVEAANPERLDELRKHILDITRDRPDIYVCGFRTPVVASSKFKKVACFGCMRGCIRAIYEADNGKKGKFMCQSLNLYSGHAPRYYGELGDYHFLASRLCDEYGIDTIAITEIILWLRRCHREGILTDENTGMALSTIGSMEFIETLLRKISFKEGFGEILASGIFEAAEQIGGKAKELIGDGVHKSNQSYFYGPRLYIISGLLYMTEPRCPWGPLHEFMTPLHSWIDWRKGIEGVFVSDELLRSISRRFFGSEIALDFSTYEGKALAAKSIQDREEAKECLILCDLSWPITFVKHPEDHIGDPSLESKLLSAITGMEVDEDGLYKIGERVFNLRRAILIGEGWRDELPDFDFSTPQKSTLANPDCIVLGKKGEVLSMKGNVLDREKFEELKKEYYKLRGWDANTGLQTKSKLSELGLDEITPVLEAKGLLK